MFKFAEIEKEEHEKKVLRDCRALAAKKVGQLSIDCECSPPPWLVFRGCAEAI